jgi:hypothetical protein
MSELNKIKEVFFKENKEALQLAVQGAFTAESIESILRLKTEFDSQKAARGGCSACRLRALMSKYTPMVSRILQAATILPQSSDEKVETRRASRKRRLRESRQRRG